MMHYPWFTPYNKGYEVIRINHFEARAGAAERHFWAEIFDYKLGNVIWPVSPIKKLSARFVFHTLEEAKLAAEKELSRIAFITDSL